MNEQDFITFINTTTTRGGCTFNLKTSNVSKQARDLLANSQYKSLAKQHINGSVKSAYYNNGAFKKKLEDVMSEYNITIIA